MKNGIDRNSVVRKGKLNHGLRKWPFIFLAPFLVSYMVFFMYPILYSFYISLFRWDVTEPKKFVGIQNYIKLFSSDPYFLKSVGNTFIIMVATIPLVIFLGLFLSELLFSDGIKYRNFFQTANYLPYITTPVAIAIIFSLMFDQKIGVVNLALVKLGIFNEGINWLTAPNYLQRTMLVLMIVWQWTGYYMLMYLAGMSSIPVEVYEAAKVDGASRFTTFRKITVPLLSNVTSFLVITSVIYLLQLLDQPYLLLRGLGQGAQMSIEKPLMTVMTNFMDQSLKMGRIGYGAATTYSLFLIILVFTLIGMVVIKKGGKILEEKQNV